MRSEKSIQFISKNPDLFNHFCEIGVYEYSYCRLQEQIASGKRVTLFECHPRCVADIKANIAHYPKTTLVDVAIYKEKGLMTMTDVGASTHIEDGLICPAKVAGYETYGNFEVRTDTFDKYDDGSIDALFIDIEGCEFYVLDKMNSWPKIIEIETHYKNYKNPMMDKIMEWMSNNDYIVLDTTESDTIFLRKSESYRI